MNRHEAKKREQRGEANAVWFLRLKGWRIIGERITSPRGEVDLIPRRRKSVAFVEVKARTRRTELDPAMHPNSLRRVAAAVEILLPKHGKACENIQIDAILVAPWRMPHHLPNVWHG